MEDKHHSNLSLTIVIPKSDSDYVQKQCIVYVLKFYLSIKTFQKVVYNLEKLKDDLGCLCSANLGKVKAITGVVENERAVVDFKTVSEDDFADIIESVNSYQQSLDEVTITDAPMPLIADIYDTSSKSEKDISNEYLISLISKKEEK